MLRAHDQHIAPGEHRLVVPPRGHRSSNRIENTCSCTTRVIRQTLRRITTIHAQRTLIRRKTPLHVQRLPGVHLLVLSDQKRKLARMPHTRLIDFAWAGTAQVDHHQPQGPPNRRIGPPSRAEDTGCAVDVQSLPDRTIDDKQRRGRMVRTLHAVQAHPLVTHRFHPCHHHWEIVGLATCHDGIDRDLFNRCLTKVRRHKGNHLICRSRCRGQHTLHALLCRRHHRQSIGDPLLEVKLDRIDIFGNLIHTVPASVLRHPLPLCKLIPTGQRLHCRRSMDRSSSLNRHADIAL